MVDLLKDLSVLTSIGKCNLDSLSSKGVSIISHCVAEAARGYEDKALVDIGIGVLEIYILEDGVQYRFIPSDTLHRKVSSAALTKESPLTLEIDEALGRRLSKTHKDLF